MHRNIGKQLVDIFPGPFVRALTKREHKRRVDKQFSYADISAWSLVAAFNTPIALNLFVIYGDVHQATRFYVTHYSC
jgi:hypothetical protein